MGEENQEENEVEGENRKLERERGEGGREKQVCERERE